MGRATMDPTPAPSRPEPRIRVFPHGKALATAAADRFLAYAREAIDLRGAFHVALSGGSTPALLFDELAASDRQDSIDWSRVHLYWGDERAVGPDDPQSNFRLARERLIDPLGLDPSQVHRLRGEESDLAKSARAYERVLAESLPPSARDEHGFPVFDLVLLGMGADGHTASLFPGTRGLDETTAWVVAHPVPSLGVDRLTLTFPVLNASRAVLFLVTGEAKQAALTEILGGASALPAARVQPAGRLEWYLDSAANPHPCP